MCAPRKYLSLNSDKSSNTKNANCLMSTTGEYIHTQKEIHIDLNIQKPINMSKIITIKAEQTKNERTKTSAEKTLIHTDAHRRSHTFIYIRIRIGIE